MSTDSSNIPVTNDGQGSDPARSVRTRVNEVCLRQLETDGVMDEGRRKRLRAMLNADTPPKAEEFVTLLQEQPKEAV